MLSNELFVVLGVLTLFIMDTLEGKAKWEQYHLLENH
jgi:hypothetical protein